MFAGAVICLLGAVGIVYAPVSATLTAVTLTSLLFTAEVAIPIGCIIAGHKSSGILHV